MERGFSIEEKIEQYEKVSEPSKGYLIFGPFFGIIGLALPENLDANLFIYILSFTLIVIGIIFIYMYIKSKSNYDEAQMFLNYLKSEQKKEKLKIGSSIHIYKECPKEWIDALEDTFPSKNAKTYGADIKNNSNNIDESKNDAEFDELELLFSKNRNILSDSDRTVIRTIIEERKKEIDKELGK